MLLIIIIIIIIIYYTQGSIDPRGTEGDSTKKHRVRGQDEERSIEYESDFATTPHRSIN